VKGQQIPVSDLGLQPERTIFAWNRTMVSLLAASAVFLRWLPYHGASVLILVALTSILALGILASQRTRYRKMARGVEMEQVSADVAAVLFTAGSVVLLGVCAIAIVLWVGLA